MWIEDCEELVRIEADELSEDLFGMGYADLTPELQSWVRTLALDTSMTSGLIACSTDKLRAK